MQIKIQSGIVKRSPTAATSAAVTGVAATGMGTTTIITTTAAIAATTVASASARIDTITRKWVCIHYNKQMSLYLKQCCQMAKFDPFLSLDCAGVEGVRAQSKEWK